MGLLTRFHPFTRRMRRELAADRPLLSAERNFATYRFGPNPPDESADRRHWRRFVRRHGAELAAAWDRLEDDESREVLVESLSFRCLGWERVERRRNTEAYRAIASTLPEHSPRFPVLEPRIVDLGHKFAHVHDVPELGLRLATVDGFFLNVLQNRQYHLERPGIRIAVEEGDVVVDCGAAWGDTSILFAQEAGPGGRVLAYEFAPSNLELFERNLALNPHVADRVELVRHAVSDADGVEIRYSDDGTSTRVGEGDSVATTLTIDELVRSRSLDSVDYLKMDIEGAESAALRGAADTIRRFRPKLAICVYHRAEDFHEIPELIASIEPAYRFWLDHHTIHGEETVLYAIAP